MYLLKKRTFSTLRRHTDLKAPEIGTELSSSFSVTVFLPRSDDVLLRWTVASLSSRATRCCPCSDVISECDSYRTDFHTQVWQACIASTNLTISRNACCSDQEVRDCCRL